MTLREGLLWLMGAGAGVVAFYVLDRLEHSVRHTPAWFLALRNWYILLGAEDRRWTAFGLTGLLAVLAYLLTLLMGYSAPPGPWRAWVEELFTVARRPSWPARWPMAGWPCGARTSIAVRRRL